MNFPPLAITNNIHMGLKSTSQKFQSWQRIGVLLIWAGIFILVFPSLLARPVSHSIDETLYMSIAQNIAQGRGIVDSFGEIFSAHPPLFPLILSLVFKITGFSIEAATIVAKFFTWFNVLMIYYLGRILFNQKVGWASALIAASSPYINSFATRILLDNIQSAFMLFSLVLLAKAVTTEKSKYYFLGGAALGLGVLTKETSLLWAPLPIIVAFLLKKGWGGILGSLRFYITFGMTIIWWWIYFYAQTGQIYLMHRAGRDFGFIIGPLIIFLGIMVVSVLIVGYLISQKKVQVFNFRLFVSKLNSSPWGIIIGISLLLISIFLLTLAMMSLGAPIRDLSDFLRRFLRIVGYVQEQIIVQEPWQGFALFGWLAIVVLGIYKHRTGERILMLALTLYFPFLYLAAVPTNKEFPIRNFQSLIWLSYLVLGYFLLLVLKVARQQVNRVAWKRPTLRTSATYALPFMICAALLVIRIVTGYTFLSNNKSANYLKSDGAFNNSIITVSKWINDNLPENSKVMTTLLFSYTLDLLDKDTFQYYKFPVQRIESQYPGISSDYLYIDKNEWGYSYYYTGISLKEILNNLEEQNIDYLVISTYKTGAGIHLTRLPSIFMDHPAFSQVYHRASGGFNYYVFQVNKSQLYPKAYTSYPASVDQDTANFWIAQSDHYGKYAQSTRLLNSLGNRPLIVMGDSLLDPSTYRKLAKMFVTSNVNIASFEIYQAYKLSNIFSGEDVQLALEWSERFPHASGPWLLLGTFYHQYPSQIEKAQAAYQKAISVSDLRPEILVLAYQGLAKLSLETGNYDQAASYYQLALYVSIFDNRDTQALQHFARAQLYQEIGMLDYAIKSYTEYLEMEFNKVETAQTVKNSFLSYDFVSEFGRAHITEAENDIIRTGVTNIRARLIKLIYAHPNTEFEYTVTVPRNASLEFVPYISPEVWQYNKGDGVQFRVVLTTRSNQSYYLYDSYWDPKNLASKRETTTESIDLWRWAGQIVKITFSTYCGQSNDCTFDWAAWGDPYIVQPISFNFIEQYSKAKNETLNPEEQTANVSTQTIKDETRDIIFQHSSSNLTYTVTLPVQSSLSFGLGMSEEVWSQENGDGAIYSIYIRDPEEPLLLYRVYQKSIDPIHNPADRRWFDERVDLSRFGGKTVEIIFESLPGPENNSNFDRGGWSQPVIVNETLP